MIGEYLDALMSDLDDTFDTIKRLKMGVSTIYIGGGTPTILTAEQLRDLLAIVAAGTDVSALREFTLESGRPDTIDAEKLRIARELGVNLKQGYNGDLSASQNGHVGGYMVKRLIERAERQLGK